MHHRKQSQNRNEIRCHVLRNVLVRHRLRACSTTTISREDCLFDKGPGHVLPLSFLGHCVFFDMSIDLHVTVKVSASHLNGSISYYIVSTRIGLEATLFPFWIQLARVATIPGFVTFSWDCLHSFWDGLCCQSEYSTQLRLSLHQWLESKSRRHGK